jgi:adenylylsulfate kinase
MPARKILICGLPGSGKTTLARALQNFIPGSIWYDGDEIRNLTQNWSFDGAGRHNQCEAMRVLCDKAVANGHTAIASFICPTDNFREQFGADYIVFVDRVVACQYRDTNVLWQPPHNADFNVHPIPGIVEPSPRGWAHQILNHINMKFSPPAKQCFDRLLPSALMVGRFQPWHKGHRALFEKALEKYGQVIIAVRTIPHNEKNPLDPNAIFDCIRKDLVQYEGKYVMLLIPNVAAVVYGRNVGYAIDQIRLDPELEKISGTELRKYTPFLRPSECRGSFPKEITI